MEHRRKVNTVGLAVITLAAVLRLLSADFFVPLGTLLQKNGAMSALIYLSTGTVLRFPSQAAPEVQEPPTEPTEPTEPSPPMFPQSQVGPILPEELSLVQVQYQCSYRPQLEALLMQEKEVSLQGAQPTVLILHSHATECYTGEDIAYSGTYRTLEADKNMLAVGQELARVLRAGGVEVIHDATLHDYPDYGGAYGAARQTVQQYLQQYPSICLVLDLHRDASDNPAGQLVTVAASGGQRSAQLMLLVGTDAGGNRHPQWEENLSLALKLAVLLERNNPGISRPVTLRRERFNMDLCPGSLLVEVGAAGNTLPEALIAANALGQAILQLGQLTGS